MIHYHVYYKNPLTHYLDITITITHNVQEEINLQLPAWRPGRYELQHFAQKIRDVKAVAGTKSIPIQKITKDRWIVKTNGAETIQINYSFYARQMDAGGSWLDEQQLYLNGINCFMAVVGQEHQPCQLKLFIPDSWVIACGLKSTGKHTLQASDFDELVDSPLICSSTLKKATYYVNEIPFYIWIQGACNPDWEKITQDFKLFTEAQLKVFGDFPVQEYHYLNQILPYRYYHSVEHANSTVITLGPDELLMAPALYKEFIGVSSHELFHTWNIKKIRPQEMMPYDYSRENYFRTGYIAEGITTYYGDYILARAGVFTASQYFEELNTTLQRYFADNGNHHLSVADSSFDLWLDGYKAGIPDRKVSIYVKGALTALLLDLQLRQATYNRSSLDTVMQRLWEDFGKKGVGYTEQDYVQLVENIAGRSFKNYFDNYIQGTSPIESVLDEALHYVGCTLSVSKNPLLYESLFGIKVAIENQTIKIAATAPHSPASEALSIDDELVALNGRKLEQNLQPLLAEADMNNPVRLTLFRNKQLREVALQASEQYYAKYTIEKREDASEKEKLNFKLWLQQDF